MKRMYQQTKGGVGKTTLAVHDTVYVHDKGKKVALLDCEPSATAAKWVKEVDKAIPVVHVTEAKSAGEALIDLAKSNDYVVVDSPGRDDSTVRTLRMLVDLVVLPVGPSILELRTLAESVSLIAEAQKHRRAPLESRIVCNQVKKRGKTSKELPEAASSFGLPLAESKVRDLELFKESAKQGNVVTRMGLSIAMIDAEALFEELLGIDSKAVDMEGNGD